MTQKIHSIILPVLNGMEDSFLQRALVRGFSNVDDSFTTIENSFKLLTSTSYESEAFNHFFHSWSMTNNSAMTVSGLSNRVSFLMHKDKPIEDVPLLFKSLASLNRITDEDLGADGGILHKELFYRMATHFCKGDTWLSKKYLSQSAKDFKAWKDYNSLKHKDIVIGLLTTLSHEIYTHGEVEFILPLFEEWLQKNDPDIARKDARQVLSWIVVHTGPTEKNHFFHAFHSVHQFTQAMGIDLESYDLEDIIATYMEKKALVMKDIAEVVKGDLEAAVAS